MQSIRVTAEYDILFEEPEEADIPAWFKNTFGPSLERGSITAYVLDEVEEKTLDVKTVLFSVDMDMHPVRNEFSRAKIATAVLNDVIGDIDVRVLYTVPRLENIHHG